MWNKGGEKRQALVTLAYAIKKKKKNTQAVLGTKYKLQLSFALYFACSLVPTL